MCVFFLNAIELLLLYLYYAFMLLEIRFVSLNPLDD